MFGLLGQLVAFIQQRIRHVYRRQRPAPLPSGTASAATNRSSESMVLMSRMRGSEGERAYENHPFRKRSVSGRRLFRSFAKSAIEGFL
jgi:hypothetical protein